MDNFKAAIADSIKKVRKKLGVTQAGLEVLFNAAEPRGLQTTQTDISRYELCKTVCPADKYLKFQSLVE